MVIKDMLDSKKFIAAILASLVTFAGVKFAGLTVQEAAMIAGPLYVYMGAQAVADFGKEAEKVRQVWGSINKEDA